METTVDSPLPVYHDKWIRLLGIPIITAFGHYLTYNQTQLNSLFVYELVSDALKIFIIWQVFGWFVRWLDKTLSWNRNFLLRLFVQVFTSWLLCSFLLTGLVFLDYTIVRPYPNENYFNFDLVVASIFILFINAIYVGLYFYDVSIRSETLISEHEPPAHVMPAPVYGTFLIRLGKREVVINQEDILCLFAEDKETWLLTAQNKLYPLESSLDKLSVQLSDTLFFRVNRKYVLSIQQITSVQPDTYGKLIVYLKLHPRLPEQLLISRSKAAAFRHWLKTYHSSVK